MLKYYKLAVLGGAVLAGVFFNSCGTSKTYSETKDDDEHDIKDAKKVAHSMYKDLMTADSLTMLKWIAKSDAAEFVSEIKEVVKRRAEDYGALKYFEVFDVSTHSYRSNKGDTLEYTFTVKAFYEYLTSEDWFTLKKVGKQKWAMLGYDLDVRHYYSCGYDEIQRLEKVYQDFSYYLSHQNKKDMGKMGNCSVEFLDTLVKLSEEVFGKNITVDTVTYIDGYFRSECGTKGYASGFMLYEVEYNDTASIFVTYSLTRQEEDDQFYINTVYTSLYVDIDTDEEVDLLKDISKDLWSLIKKGDARGLYEAFHQELKDLFNNQREVEDMMNDFKEIGEFEDFFVTRTFNTGGNSADDYAYYIAVLELKNKDDKSEYIEMVFKPNEQQKFMLHSIRDL